MEAFTIICATIAASVGFWLGYASCAKENKGNAVFIGFAGALVGAIVGALAAYIVVVIALLAIMGYAFVQWFSEQ